MLVPTEERQLISFTSELIQQCRVSSAERAAYCRLMHSICETGRYDGSKSLINLLHSLLDRTAAHLFSPVELRFSIDFERKYPKYVYDQAKVVSEVLTRHWDRNSIDILFARGVFESLKYGLTLMKQYVKLEGEGEDEHPVFHSKLVMPWQFGVYNEAENDINAQSALCETTMMTLPDIWERIWYMPNARKLYDRIRAHSSKGNATSDPQSFFHQVLSTSQLDTGLSQSTRPGGILQMGNAANGSIMGPVVAADMVQVHELWVQDGFEYTTILMVEPDVIISPMMVNGKVGKKSNLLGIPRLQPYRVIQANEVTNYFWGRSELVDVTEPQVLLSTWADDARRLFGLQVDRILGFIGETGLTDERYGQMRAAGFMGVDVQSKIQDLTPPFPPETIPMLRFAVEIINMVGGYTDLMQGKGESGVRAGVHADTLMKTGSPQLRDRSLLIERQCAVHADLTLALREAKDKSKFWTKADQPIKDVEESSFLLNDLPSDWRVIVDSHSSSPIFSNDSVQLVAAAHKMGVVDGEYFIDNTQLPNKEAAKTSLREREARKAAMMERMLAEFPELGEKIVAKQLTGGKR